MYLRAHRVVMVIFYYCPGQKTIFFEKLVLYLFVLNMDQTMLNVC